MQSLRQYRDFERNAKRRHATRALGKPASALFPGILRGVEKKEPCMVEWDGPKDPANPRNWPLSKRAGILCIIWLNVWALDWAGSADSQASSKISSDFHVSVEAETLSPALYTFGIGTGALFAGPISESVGRNPIYIGSRIFQLCWLVGAALAPNFGAQCVFRFLAGLGGSIMLAIHAASIADMFSIVERTVAWPLISLASFYGPTTAPIAGAWIARSSISWRWTEWISVILSGFTLVLTVLFLPETFAPILLSWKASHLRRVTGDTRYLAELDRQASLVARVKTALRRALHMLTKEPIVALLGLWLVLVYVVVYSFLQGLSFVFGDTYEFSRGLVGTSFAAILLGTNLWVCTVPVYYYLYKRKILQLEVRNGDETRFPGQQIPGKDLPAPEYRLWAAAPVAVLLPISLFWLGWTNYSSISPWSSLGALTLFGTSWAGIYIIVYQYILDVYGIYAGSALAIITFFRYYASGAVNLFARPIPSLAENLEGKNGRNTAVKLTCTISDMFTTRPNDVGQDKLWVSWGAGESSGESGSLRLFARFGTPAYDYFLGRERLVDYDSDGAIRRIREWLDRCNTTHNLWCARKRNTPLPRRVIDLGPPSESSAPVLLETHGTFDRYVALSYCWGALPQVKTLRHLLKGFAESIDESQLSRTIRDAFCVTRRLELRYIWIDALCIVQDDPADFNVEALKMSQYYGNAYLTIAAGFAAGCHDGFLRRQQSSSDEVELRYSRPEDQGAKIVEHGTVFACLGDTVDRGERDALEFRGWTLQESVLSSRMLNFGSKQMSFTCLEARFDEDGSIRPSFGGPTDRDRIPMSLDVMGYDRNEPRRKKNAFYRWYAYLQQYTLRTLGQRTDKLTAIAGIAQRVNELSQSRYLFGIWEDDIARGLAWRSTELGNLRLHRSPLTRVENGVPSWSWAAYEGPVFHGYALFPGPQSNRDSHRWQPENYCVSFLNCQEVCDSFDPIRKADPKSGKVELQVRGNPKHVRKSVCTPSAYFDKGGDTRASSGAPRNRMILLQKVQVTDETPSDSESAAEALRRRLGIVALGGLDVWPADDMAEFVCLRLIKREGILLSPVGNHRYKRVGIFWVVDHEWFEKGPLEDMVLV
ncbi:hypothetical protein MBLNU459_g6020t1 [Dothideomycetes sp. NU459]